VKAEHRYYYGYALGKMNGNIFIGYMGVGLFMFAPLAVSVLGEKDEHVCGWEVAADDFNDTLWFIAFVLGQMY